ncbi:hypothetical protein ACFQZE_06420 [Paenibacillus sp. GCM10027627]|uniref:hypothetical protein n=1 Tax=unclassified Paenibacillus TaxID=185978 RepID=UPI003627756E
MDIFWLLVDLLAVILSITIFVKLIRKKEVSKAALLWVSFITIIAMLDLFFSDLGVLIENRFL